MLDTTVRLRGVSAVTLSSNEVVSGAQLRVPGRQFIQVLQKAPTNAFSAGQISVGMVSTSSPAELGLHRVRVRGVVTLAAPEDTCFLQDDTGAVKVRFSQKGEILPGKALEVVAFPVADALGSRLEAAIFRYDEPAPPVVARETSASELPLPASHRSELIKLECQLLNDAGGSTMPLLLLQCGSQVFQARFASGDTRTPAPIWLAGSRLSVTGVYDLQAPTANGARSFVLILRNPEDVLVLALPPSWTPREAFAVAGGMAAVSFGVLGWVVMLRRTVRRQTNQIRQRLEAEAGLEKQLMLVWETSSEGMCMTDAEGGFAG